MLQGGSSEWNSGKIDLNNGRPLFLPSPSTSACSRQNQRRNHSRTYPCAWSPLRYQSSWKAIWQLSDLYASCLIRRAI
jgi:hypothetical protein